MKRCLPWLLCLALHLILALSAHEADAWQNSIVLHPGYRSLSYSLPNHHFLLKLSVWYPTKRKPSLIKEGVWTFQAARHAPLLHGPWPMILLSHDNSESSLSHHGLAAAFASKGYIVVAPTHDRDNADDMSLLFHESELVVRALQIKSSMDFILEHPLFSPEIDRSRIAYLGFGLPSAAGLLLRGATLTPDGWNDFYARHCASAGIGTNAATDKKNDSATPQKEGILAGQAASSRSADKSEADTNLPAPPPNLNPGARDSLLSGTVHADERKKSDWCSPMVAYKMDRLVQTMRRRLNDEKTNLSSADQAGRERERLLQRQAAIVSRFHARSVNRHASFASLPSPPVILPLLPPPQTNTDVLDNRFCALAFVSPGFSFMFEPGSLSAINTPSLFIGASKDTLNIPQEQALRFASLAGANAEYAELPKASIVHLRENCSDSDPAAALASLCGNIPDMERTSLHQLLAMLLHDFFCRAFKNTDSSVNAPRTAMAN